jgi:hypothetical protein
MQAAGRLNVGELGAFAEAGKLDESSIALAMMWGLTVGLVERALVAETCDRILVLCSLLVFRGRQGVR